MTNDAAVVADESAKAPGRPAPVYSGAPVLGALAHFRDDLLGTLLRAADLGSVVRFRMPAGVPVRTYGVFSPEGADRLLAGSAAGYRKDSRPYAETAAFFGDGLLTSQDERWHRQRRFVAPLFTPRRISRDYVPVLVQEAVRMRSTWAASLDATASRQGPSPKVNWYSSRRRLSSLLDPSVPGEDPS